MITRRDFQDDEPDGPIDQPIEDPPVVKHCGEDGLTPEEYEQMEWDAFDSGETTMTNDGNYSDGEKDDAGEEEADDPS